jgi:aquaporin Z
MRNPWNAVIAEMTGTFLFFFVGIGAAGSLSRMAASGVDIDLAASLIVIALAHGIVLAVLVSALGAVSGAHFNPAVTVGMWLAGQIPSRRAVSYILAQLIGAVLAAWMLRAIFPADVFPELGIPRLFDGLDPLTGLGIEAVLTAILVVAVFGTAIDPRGSKVGGLAIGLALVAGILMGGPLTGGALNPARWFGPAAVLGDWVNSAVWIVGPVIGAIVAALAYRFLFLPEADLERTPAMPDA